MANFVEKATLILEDKVTPKTKPINKELNAIFNIASKINGLNININVKLSGYAVALRQVNKLESALSKLTKVGAMPKLKVSVDSNQLLVANSRAKTLEKQLAKNLQAVNIPANRLGRPPNTGGQAQLVGPQNVVQRQQRQQNFEPTARERRSEIIREGFSLIRNELRSQARNVIPSAKEGVMDADDVNLRLRQMGLSVSQSSERMSQALKISTEKFSGLTAAQIAESSIEIAGLQTNQKDVVRVMEDVARSGTILAGVYKDTKVGAEQARQMARVVGLQNLSQDPAKARELTDAITRSIIATGGDVNPGEVRRMLQQMKGFGPGLSASAISDLISFRDEGGKASTEEFRSFLNGLTRQNLNQKDKNVQIREGLRDKEGFSTLGNRATKDPIKYIQNEVLPNLRQKGVDIRDAESIRKGLSKFYGLGQSESAAPIRVILNNDQIDAERAQNRRVNADAGFDQASLRGKIAELDSQFQNAAAGVTKALLPTTKGAIEAITGTLKSISAAADAGKTPSAGDALKLSLGLASVGAFKIIQGMTSSDSQVNASSTAAFALIGSAKALTLSAGALTGAADLQRSTGAISSLLGAAAGATPAGRAIGGALRLGSLLIGLNGIMDEAGSPATPEQIVREKENRNKEKTSKENAVKTAEKNLEKAKTDGSSKQKIEFETLSVKTAKERLETYKKETAAIEELTQAIEDQKRAMKEAKELTDASSLHNKTMLGETPLGKQEKTNFDKTTGYDQAESAIKDLRQESDNKRVEINFLVDKLKKDSALKKTGKGKKAKFEKEEVRQKRITDLEQQIINAEKALDAKEKDLKETFNPKLNDGDTALKSVFRDIADEKTKKVGEEENKKLLKRAQERASRTKSGLPAEKTSGEKEADVNDKFKSFLRYFADAGALRPPAEGGGDLKTTIETKLPAFVTSFGTTMDAGAKNFAEAGTTFGNNAKSPLQDGGPFGSSAASAFFNSLNGRAININVNTGAKPPASTGQTGMG